MAGAFNSINKISGSFSTGLVHLCFDHEFMLQRDKLRVRKPKHVLEGLEYGLNSIVNGFGKGISG